MGKRGPACTICEHTKRAEIEALLREQSVRMVASYFRLSTTAVENHKRQHGKLEPGSEGQAAGRAPRGGSRSNAPPRPTPTHLPDGASQVDQARAHLAFNRSRLCWEAAWGDGKSVVVASAGVLASAKLVGRLTGAHQVTAKQIVEHPEFVKVMGYIFEVLQSKGDLETSGQLRRVMARLEAGETP